MNQRRSFLCALPLLAASVRAWGAGYPSRPITWVVPFPPGGITDTTSRQLAKKVGETLGQSIVVENRPGAGGSMGTEQVARAPADGYTMLYGTQGTMAANLFLYKNLKYDPLRDFVPVQGMFVSPLVLVVPASKPWASVKDLVEYARANPNKLSYGSAGSGTGTHLTCELFQTETSTDMLHVPYRGSSPALLDLMGGRVDLMFDYVSVVTPHLKSGKLRALAVTAAEPVEILPDVPTIGSAGYPGAVSTAWSGVVMPAGTPAEAVNRLADAMHGALVDPEISTQFIAQGSRPMPEVRLASFREFIQKEQVKWAAVVKKSGATLG